jgi:hypothetical protein
MNFDITSILIGFALGFITTFIAGKLIKFIITIGLILVFGLLIYLRFAQ